ncbi:MAG: hypothetical protein MJ137_01895 [Clostridia bacterium]|nr:hypothetical protein [Clostridia bacterium]
MTVVLPVVLSAVFTLLLFAVRLSEAGEIRRIASKYATTASMEYACPGYLSLLSEEHGPTPSFSGELPSGAAIGSLSSEHRPYRYFSDGYSESFGVLEKAMKIELQNSMLAGKGEYECEISLSGSGLRHRIDVRIRKLEKKELPGIKRELVITASAAVSDCSEFVRNTDLALELTGKLWERLGLGSGSGTADRITAFRDSFSVPH